MTRRGALWLWGSSAFPGVCVSKEGCAQGRAVRTGMPAGQRGAALRTAVSRLLGSGHGAGAWPGGRGRERPGTAPRGPDTLRLGGAEFAESEGDFPASSGKPAGCQGPDTTRKMDDGEGGTNVGPVQRPAPASRWKGRKMRPTGRAREANRGGERLGFLQNLKCQNTEWTRSPLLGSCWRSLGKVT